MSQQLALVIAPIVTEQLPSVVALLAAAKLPTSDISARSIAFFGAFEGLLEPSASNESETWVSCGQWQSSQTVAAAGSPGRSMSDCSPKRAERASLSCTA
jgi:hypothetical protein